jgi:rSAM/selenodomain-associated transferase 1
VSAPIPVLVFARVPRAGAVKRRLIPVLGAASAARLYERMLEAAVRAALCAGIGPVMLWHTPDTAHPALQRLRDEYGVSLHGQGRGDLGTRMHRAFRLVLGSHPGALLMGSDCPSLRPGDLRRGARALDQGYEVVLGPAADGGYYLIGLARPMPALFHEVPWGSGKVLAITRQRLHAAGSCWRELAVRRDIDRPEDLAGLERTWWQGAGAGLTVTGPSVTARHGRK